MHVCASVQDAFENCLSSKTFSLVCLKEHPLSEITLSSDVYSIFFSSVSLDVLVYNHTYRMTPDSVVIIKPFEFAAFMPSSTLPADGYLLTVHPEFLHNLMQYRNEWEKLFAAADDTFIHLCFPMPEQHKALIKLLQRMQKDMDFGTTLYQKHACIELLLLLYNCYSTPHHTENAPERFFTQHQISGQPFHLLLSFLNRHITQPLTREMITENFYISDTYLCRIFKSYTGFTLNHYINACRISLSKAYLAKGYSVSKCLTRCGYHEYSTFLKAFKKHTGSTPREYLKSKQFYDSHSS